MINIIIISIIKKPNYLVYKKDNNKLNQNKL